MLSSPIPQEAIINDKDLKPESEKIIDDLFYNNAKNLYLSKKQESSKFYKPLLLLTFLALGGMIIYNILKKTFKTVPKN